MVEVVDRLSRKTHGEAIIVSDVGQHQMHAARHYRFRHPLSHITSGGLGTMGFALPAAIGAKLGVPEREVIAIVGDGGFQMTLQELGTIMQEAIAVKIIVLNNGCLGMVRQWQELFFEKRYSAATLENPDFVAIAKGYGIAGQRISERNEMHSALDGLLAASGPYLLEVRVSKEENVFPMIAAGASVSEIRLS
jgi:acetolactate synthase-1/2/3 large subunit